MPYALFGSGATFHLAEERNRSVPGALRFLRLKIFQVCYSYEALFRVMILKQMAAPNAVISTLMPPRIVRIRAGTCVLWTFGSGTWKISELNAKWGWRLTGFISRIARKAACRGLMEKMGVSSSVTRLGDGIMHAINIWCKSAGSQQIPEGFHSNNTKKIQHSVSKIC